MFSFASTVATIVFRVFSAVVSFFTMIAGFISGNGIYRDTIIYTDQFGYNNYSSDYYCYLSSESKYSGYNKVNLYILDTDETIVVYERDDPKESITMQQVEGDTVSYVVWYDDEATKYYYEIGSGEVTSEPYYSDHETAYFLDTKATVDMGDRGTVYFTKRFGDEELYYSLDDDDYEQVSGAQFRTRSIISGSQLTYEDGIIYGVVTGYKGMLTGPQTFRSPDMADCESVKSDVFFSFDPKNGEYNELYTTPNGYTRVIGYHDGVVYLWYHNKIIKRDIATGKETVLDTIDTKEKVRFVWAGRKLIVFDDINGLVEKILEE